MVNIIENWVQIKGRVTDVTNHPQLGEYDMIGVSIIEKKQYRNFPDLVTVPTANKLKVNLRKTTSESLGLKEGIILQGLVRAAGRNEYFFKEEKIKVVK
jgi:hypothetical protein